MSLEAWGGEPDGRPFPTPQARRIRVREGDFRDFDGRTVCAPQIPVKQCALCARHRPALARQINRQFVVIDATAVTSGASCPMFFPWTSV